MLPYIHIGTFVFESYTLFINLGTLIGAFIMYELLEKHCKPEKYRWKLVGIVLAIMAASIPFAKFIKGLFRHGNGQATHFLGRVLAAAIILEVVYYFWWKEKGCLLQAKNAVVMYLAVQHLFNRIACYLNGCCGGKKIANGTLVFPSQLAEAFCMLVLIILIAVKIYQNQSFYYPFYMLFAIIIFFSEFMIEDTRIGIEKTSIITGVQLGAILLFASSLGLYIWHIRLPHEKVKIP